MPLKKTIYPLLFYVFFICGDAYATHIIGGEVSYRCLGNNAYEIKTKIYRDCYYGIPPLDNPAYFTIFDTSGKIIINESVALSGDTILPVIATSPCLIVPPDVCVEEGTYIFNVTLPPIAGGYIIVYQRCCRNAAIINIVDPGNTGSTYLSTISEKALTVCDNSPVFKNYPPIVICAELPLSFDHSAYDADGDSLVYYLCQPLDGANSTTPEPTVASTPPYDTVTYVPPYTYTDPMNGSPPLEINSKTGLLTIIPTALGRFLVGICVDEYRNGVLLGTHHRDFQFYVVNCQPTVVASIPGFVRNCKTDSITFQNFSTGGSIYHWNFGVPGLTNDTSDLEFPTYSFPDTGTFQVTLSVDAGNNCYDTATSTVAIYPDLIANSITPNGCAGIPINFTNSSTISNGKISSWSWAFGDNNFSNMQDPSHTYINPNSYVVSLLVISNKGCRDSISKTIIVHPTPVVTASPNDSIICSLDKVQLYGNVQGNGTYLWSPNYHISSDSAQNPIVSPDSTITYYLTAINTFGCEGIDSVRITFYDTIYVNAGPDTLICRGDKINLQGSAYAAHFNWVLSATLNNPAILNPTVDPIDTTQYIIIASAGTCKASDSVLIAVLTRPTLLAGPDNNICFGDTSSLSASGCTSYSWSPAATVQYPFQPNTLAFPQETTTYYVSGIDSTKCPITVKDSEIIFVHHPELRLIKNDTTIVNGTSAQLWALYGITFNWYPTTGMNDPTSQYPIVSPTSTTTYYVTSTDAYGCTGSDSMVVTVTNQPIVVIPNAFSPNGDGVNDSYSPIIIGLVSNYDFRIYNRWGQLIYETNDPDKSWDGTFDGKPQNIDVYVYVLNATATLTGKNFFMKGNVSLLR